MLFTPQSTFVSCSMMESQLRTEHDDAVRVMTAQHADEIDRLEAQHAHTIQLLQEAAHANDLRSEAALADAQRASEQRERQLRTDSTHELTQTMRDMEVANLSEFQRMRNEAQANMRQVQDRHADELADVAAKAGAELRDSLCQATERQHMIANERDSVWVAQCRQHVQAQCNELAASHREAMHVLTSQHAQEVADVAQHWTTRLGDERTAHAAALQELRQVLEGKVAAEVESCRRDMLEQKGTAVMTTTAKWQRALADTNARLEVEKKVAYDKGVADREAEWQRAALLIKAAQKEECDSKEALKVCEEKFQLALATKTAQLQQACDNAIAAHKKTAQEALDEAVASTRDTVERTTAKAVEDEWREKLLAQKVALEEALQQACHEVEARVLQTSVEQHHVALKQWEEAKAAELAKVQSTLRGQFAQQTHDSEMALRREKEIAVQAVNDQWAMKLDAVRWIEVTGTT
ncbi:hypothetical protein DYB38_009468 [Aphanomyces astaci]|uniref:Uncharacterized protein n=1 Tax=Aphanomyces astaci TaxID=112090 RepID=A0A397CD31_APHAT|nr:hypothetical protein DYB38_009468 [Aphanomyces astaci]